MDQVPLEPDAGVSSGRNAAGDRRPGRDPVERAEPVGRADVPRPAGAAAGAEGPDLRPRLPGEVMLAAARGGVRPLRGQAPAAPVAPAAQNSYASAALAGFEPESPVLVAEDSLLEPLSLLAPSVDGPPSELAPPSPLASAAAAFL